MPALLPLLVLSLASCGEKTAPVEAAAEPLPDWANAVIGDMDRSADPCQDFYRYACGGWMDRTELPADKPSWTRSFSVIADQNREFLHQLLERAAAEPDAKDADWARMGHFYGACMDVDAIEKAGLTDLQPELDRISALADARDLWPLVGELGMIGADVLFTGEVEGDFLDPQLTILHLGPGGLGLPDRDYYLKDDPASKQLLADYEKHVAAILTLAGDAPEAAAASASAIVAFETKLAETHPPREELRDPSKTYHRLDRAGLEEQVPSVDWGAWLAAQGIPDVTTINVYSPEATKGMAELVRSTDLDVLKAYLRWHLLSAFAPQLGQAFFDEDHAFYGVKVYGQQEPEPRWKRCVRATSRAMGEVLGRYFVEEKFGGDSKERALAMVEDIEQAFGEGLEQLDWMDEATRKVALEKRDALGNKIGYPDKWRDYSGLEVTADDHVANVLAARRHEARWWLDQVGKPHDPTIWYMTPQMVNAYYHPLFNEMVFPAGILQPPFFAASQPGTLNYGAMGSVMGHELSHGFDDSGRQFDPHGRMVQWWSDEAVKNFEERAACVERQFDGFEAQPGLHVNGKLTLGEDIADLGGVRTAYRAWKKRYPDEAGVAGLTADQLFFVAYAQAWCTVSAPEYEKMLVTSDPHAPARFRVIGPLSNLDEFHEAFSCPVGTPMHPENTCEVW